MNFFGHAIVASWRSTSPGFVLGAMLPDFATMIGARVPRVTHPDLSDGVAFHHETDRVFHQSETFRELERGARKALRVLGVARPSALAVAHIGVEILLDASLAADTVGAETYALALADAHGGALGAHIGWDPEDRGGRYEALCRMLHERGVPRDPISAATVTYRVARALSSRPRLRLEPGADVLVENWVRDAAPWVSASAPRLVLEVSRGLSLAPRQA